jgi:myo-inositol-1(or 4)-monophosphatase
MAVLRLLRATFDPGKPEPWEPTSFTSLIDPPIPARPVSLVTSYSQEDHIWGSRFSDWLGAQCKRVTSLWAPALDLALVASGSLDAMVCHEADLLDVCSGVFLVESAGGHIVGLDGHPMEIRRSMHQLPVSFIAARGMHLVRELVENVGNFQERVSRS